MVCHRERNKAAVNVKVSLQGEMTSFEMTISESFSSVIKHRNTKVRI